MSRFLRAMNIRRDLRASAKVTAKQEREAGVKQAEADLGGLAMTHGVLGVLEMADDLVKAAERRFEDRPAAFRRGYLAAQESWLESARDAEAESLRIFGPDFMGSVDMMPIEEEG